ncbi:MAG: UDP-2,3-diacylglucosamine diphosphatase [Chitinophagaceae bacterium]
MQEIVSLPPNKKIYFASDFHFGIPDYETSLQREKKVCNWLDEIRKDAFQIYLLGDLFDAWMEYKRVVPKGFVRFLGKLAELSDAGIEIQVFTGNHDLWMHGYFEKELNIKVFKTIKTMTIHNKKFLIGHGDGLSKHEKKYKLMKGVIQHPFSQFLYRQLHPNVGIGIADYFSRLGPKHKYLEVKLKPFEQEYQWQFATEYLQKEKIDYFIFGHRHLSYDTQLNTTSRLINLGDWISLDTFAEFDGNDLLLKKWK